MLKKIIKTGIPLILILIIITISYNTYQEAIRESNNPISIIPSNACIIIQCNKSDNLFHLIERTNIWNKAKMIDQVKNIGENIKNTTTIFNTNPTLFNNNKIFISLHKVGANNIDILYSSNFSNEELPIKENIDILFKNIKSKYKYDNQIIYELIHQEKNIYFSHKEDIFFMSYSKMLVEDVIKHSTTNENLLKNQNFNISYRTINISSEINLLINYNSCFEIINTYNKEINLPNDFSEWTSTDIKLKDNVLIANGFSNIKQPVKNYTDIFLNQNTSKSNIVKIIPENTIMLLAMGFNNTKLLFEKKNKLLQLKNKFWGWDKNRKILLDSTNVDYNEIIKYIDNEAGMFSTYSMKDIKEEYTYFKSNDILSLSSLIQGIINNTKEYNGYTVHHSKDSRIISNLFGEILPYNTSYFTIINEYIIFSKLESSLQYLIDNYIGGNTLDNNLNFNNYRSYISSRSNLLFFVNPGKLIRSMNSEKKKNSETKISYNDSILNFTGLSVQISSKGNLLLNNMSLLYDTEYKENIQEEWFIQLDSSSTTTIYPQFVKNHFTKQEMILIQTKSNILYALSSEGEVVWRKEIDSEIIGKINSIDIYKNKKYQAIFNTNTHLHIIDRNGRYVDGFPKKLPKKTNIGHALFDYDNKKRYRIMIIGEDNNIYNLNSKGEKVNGWKYKKKKNRIKKTVKHFKIKNKDYILEETGNSSSRLLAINGTERVSFNSGNSFTKNPIKIDNEGTLYAITSTGKIWRGFIDGSSNELTIPIINNQSMFYINNSDTNRLNKYIVVNEKTIFITNDKFETSKSFTLKENIKEVTTYKDYIIIITSNRLYLFKEYNIIEGFPISTDGIFNISDINNNGKVNIINYKNKLLYNYELLNLKNN